MCAYKEIPVWDLFIRVFHWSLVVLFFLAYLTGDAKGPGHRFIGYTILLLVCVRIFWGFVGTKHALFSDFVCSPAKVFTYFRGLVTGKAQHFTGHNPAAAWMILFFLIGSILVCASGIMICTTKNQQSISMYSFPSLVKNVYASQDHKDTHEGKRHDRRGKNNKAEKDDDENDNPWSDLHEILAQLMLFLAFLHIAGVAVSSRIHRENLVKSMITGRKTVPV